jgi:protocatechuate 3,4-dioxygenase beta subunit
MRAGIVAALSLLTALPAVASITGTVMTRDGQPVAGAKVSVYSLETTDARRARLFAANAERTALTSTTTSAKGAFTLESPKDPVVTLRVEASGYAPAGEDVEHDDDSLVFALTAAPTKQGTITANGKPVAGARVAWIGSAEFVTTTDANGHYSAPDPAKWAQRVFVRHPDYAIREEGQFGRTKFALDYALESGVTISGKVMAGEAPAANAAIVVDNWPLATTGDDGAFTVAHAPAKWELLEARSGDRIASHAREGKSSTTLNLAPAGSIAGSVRGAKQQPVPGAIVVLVAGGGGGGRPGAGTRAVVATAIADAKGTYAFPPVLAGSYQLTIQHPAFTAPPTPVAVTASAHVQKALFAMPRSRVSGTVLDDQKVPVAAAAISADTVSRDPMGLPRQLRRMANGAPPARPAFSGPDGRFSIRTDSEGDVELEAAKKGLPTGKSTALHVAPGDRKTGVVITLPRGLALTGRVTDPAGKPLSGVVVSASQDEGGPMPGNARRMIFGAMRGLADDGDAIMTGSDGMFSMRVKEGTYDVNFKREGFAAKNVRAVSVNATAKPIEVKLDPGVEITGRVVRGGNGVEGVNVAVMSTDAMSATTTTPDGHFTIADLSPGSYMVIFAKQEDFVQQMKTLNAPARDVTIELPAGGRITGHVVDKSTHQAVTSFQAGVSLARSGGGMVIDTPPMLKSFTSDDGSFTLDNVPVGSVQVVASAPGYTTAHLTNITVEAGKSLENVEVALETGVRLTGHVTGPDGSPLPGVVVRPETSSGGAMRVVRFNGGSDGVTTTDANGDYSMDQLEAGSQKSFSFSHDGYLQVTKTVDLTGRDARLDAQLSAGTRVTGSVVTDAGAPVPDADVRASSAVAGSGFRATRTDANGAFALEGLPPGHYTFSASKTGYAEGTARDFDISAGAPVQITLKSGGVIYGHVTGVTGDDLGKVTVNATSPNGSAEGAVDGGGNYRIQGAPTGSVRVSAELMRNFNDRHGTEAKVVELASGASVQVDLDFNTSTVVRGRVTRNGAPLAGGMVLFTPEARGSAAQVQVPTDDAGNYTANGLADGAYTVVVMETQRMNPYTTKYDVHGSGSFDIAIRTAQVTGRVIEAGTGDAVGKARVQLQSKEGGAGAFIGTRAATTDDGGNFTFDSVGAGTYTVSADKDGYGNDVHDISVNETSATPVELTIAKNDGILLKVVDARDGQPLNPAVVAYDGAGRQVYQSIFRGSNGDTTKLPLAPGQYRLVIAAQNYAPRTVTATSPSQPPPVSLTPGGNIEVRAKSADTSRRARLVDASGAVYARPYSPDATYSVGGTNTVINNIAAGRYRLEVLAGGSVVETKDVTVGEGQTITVDI